MDSTNKLSRYTQPTTPQEKAFFSRHSDAISRYGFAVILVQGAWSWFSFTPAIALIKDGATVFTQILPYAPVLAFAILSVLHYVLRAEMLETFSNQMDKDDHTINGWWNYALPFIICLGLFALDVKGVTASMRDKSFDGKKTVAKQGSDADLSKATLDYQTAVAAIDRNQAAEERAAAAPFAAKIATANGTKTYDAWDVAAKKRKVNALAAQSTAAVAHATTEAAQLRRDALARYNGEKQRITGILDSTHAELSNKDRDNEAKSANYGWVISVFFMLLFLFMNYKLVYLRVRSGIRINVQFTELDAEGGFFEKLMRVIASILQRQGQRFLVFIHKLGSTGTATLQNFDGRVILTAGNYNGAKQDPSVVAAAPPDISNDDINGSGNPSVPPTPPNSGGNGGNGGNGGGNDDGNTPRTPRSPQKRKKVGTVAFSSLTYERQRELAASFHEGGYIYVFLEWLDALLTTNPEVTVFDDEQLALFDRDLEHACDLASAFANKRLNPTPEAVETPPTPSVVELVLNEFEPVVTTPKTVVTTPKTVVTVEKTVTTVLEAQNNEFTYGDELLKGFKQAFGAELNNIKVGNGKKESIMPRLIVKSAAFDKAVREVKATPKLRTEICEWVGDNVQPLISEFLTGAKEGEKK